MLVAETVLINNHSRCSVALLRRLSFLMLLAVTLMSSLSATAVRVADTDSNSNSGYDGPAQLPIATVASSMADTPAPGSILNVSVGGELQTALNSADCGDTIELQSGATFTGVFNFPAKNCDDQHWIIVRSSSLDTALPAEGQRATPCYAGVASLVGRPQYTCANPQNVMAKLVVSQAGNGPVVFQSGANHYRLLGLEITRQTRSRDHQL